jgi:hypothetical protein
MSSLLMALKMLSCAVLNLFSEDILVFSLVLRTLVGLHRRMAAARRSSSNMETVKALAALAVVVSF